MRLFYAPLTLCASEPIGNVPPAEFEASYYQSTGRLPIAA
jgi:hypothetical protein